jgi:hypothetical protein
LDNLYTLGKYYFSTLYNTDSVTIIEISLVSHKMYKFYMNINERMVYDTMNEGEILASIREKKINDIL